VLVTGRDCWSLYGATGLSGMSVRRGYGGASGSARKVPYMRREEENRSPASSFSGSIVEMYMGLYLLMDHAFIIVSVSKE
jgi:hypothetical protein